jgi:hypothetical protein
MRINVDERFPLALICLATVRFQRRIPRLEQNRSHALAVEWPLLFRGGRELRRIPLARDAAQRFTGEHIFDGLAESAGLARIWRAVTVGS